MVVSKQLDFNYKTLFTDIFSILSYLILLDNILNNNTNDKVQLFLKVLLPIQALHTV